VPSRVEALTGATEVVVPSTHLEVLVHGAPDVHLIDEAFRRVTDDTG
jgi:hypothetical protein